MLLLLFLFVFVLLAGPAAAWDQATHAWLARQVCAEFDCDCEYHIVTGAQLPAERFTNDRDSMCFNRTDACFGDDWRCPTPRTCPADTQVENWLARAKEKRGCAAWHDVGVAGAYYFEGREFFNQVLGASERDCVSPFEESVGRLIQRNQSNWTVCRCGVCVSKKDLEDMAADYADTLGFMVRLTSHETKRVVVVANSIDRALADDFYTFLGGSGFSVVSVGADHLKYHKDEPYLFFLGGHRSPEGVGGLVSPLLSEKEKRQLLTSPTAAKSFVKTNVYRPGQVVYVFAGHEKEQTRLAWQQAKDEVGRFLTTRVTDTCLADADCGEVSPGSYSCDGENLVQAVHIPKCVNGVCKTVLSHEHVERCTAGKYCVPGESRCRWLR